MNEAILELLKEDYFCFMNVSIESSWKELLSDEFEKDYFKSLVKFVKEEYTTKPDKIFPKGSQIFRALDECPVEKVKVVILGQDPYPTKGHANGLCFSINPDVHPFAKSLLNIFKEIHDDLDQPIPENGDLTRWAQQGVLLLNSILTVEEGNPLSHKDKGWEQFTNAVIQHLTNRREGIVFMLWGSKAAAKIENVDRSKNLILQSVHPSPLSAYRGFFGCKHFSKANTYLASQGKSMIEW